MWLVMTLRATSPDRPISRTRYRTTMGPSLFMTSTASRRGGGAGRAGAPPGPPRRRAPPIEGDRVLAPVAGGVPTGGGPLRLAHRPVLTRSLQDLVRPLGDGPGQLRGGRSTVGRVEL